MNFSIFQDSKGNWSSKRLFGGIIAIAGTILKIALAIYSFKAIAANPDVIQTSSTWLVGFGTGLLGISLIELFGKSEG